MICRIIAIIISLIIVCFSFELCANDTVSEYIKGMDLRQKVGQLLLIGFQGKDLSSNDITHIKNIRPCGIVFYGRNFRDATDISHLVSRINSFFKENQLPIFFAIDQEGGIVHRLEGEYYRPPSQPSIGATYSKKIAKQVGLSVGNALSQIGININIAPVLDVPADISSSPMTLRSYSDDSGLVEKLGMAYIYGLKSTGLLATAKHFPGIGRANEDSHRTLPRIVWKTGKEKESDIIPFKSAIKLGVDIIMVGHFIAEPGDGENPISLSSYWMKDVLRKAMGFDGLIMVDNIEMRIIENIMPVSEAAIRSFQRGADLIMVSHERKNQEAVFDALLHAVMKGDISIARLNESLKRIIKVKRRLKPADANEMFRNNLKDVAISVAKNAVTALKLKDATDLKVDKKDRVLYAGYNFILFHAVKNVQPATEVLNTSVALYKKMNPDVPIETFIKNFDALIVDADYPDATQIISMCKLFNLEYTIVLTHPGKIQRTLKRLQPKRIVITFENSKIHFQSAAAIIFGSRRAKGRLPYTLKLPDIYRYE